MDCVDALLNGLLIPTALRPAVVTLDLSELRCISSLAMGALVTYRRGVVRTGGRVRLAGELQPAVREALARAELLDLFQQDTAEAGRRGTAGSMLPQNRWVCRGAGANAMPKAGADLGNVG
jgi:hypothetical protein